MCFDMSLMPLWQAEQSSLPCFVPEKCLVYSGFAWHAVQVGAGAEVFADTGLAAGGFVPAAFGAGGGEGTFISASLPAASGAFVPDEPPESMPS